MCTTPIPWNCSSSDAIPAEVQGGGVQAGSDEGVGVEPDCKRQAFARSWLAMLRTSSQDKPRLSSGTSTEPDISVMSGDRISKTYFCFSSNDTRSPSDMPSALRMSSGIVTLPYEETFSTAFIRAPLPANWIEDDLPVPRPRPSEPRRAPDGRCR